MKKHLLFALNLFAIVFAAAEEPASDWVVAFDSNVPPYEHTWRAKLRKTDLQGYRNLDVRSSELPLSIKKAVALADEALVRSGFSFVERLKLLAIELQVAEVFAESHAYYVIRYGGQDTDGRLITLFVPVLMSGKVVLPEPEEGPIQLPEPTAASGRSSS